MKLNIPFTYVTNCTHTKQELSITVNNHNITNNTVSFGTTATQVQLVNHNFNIYGLLCNYYYYYYYYHYYYDYYYYLFIYF